MEVKREFFADVFRTYRDFSEKNMKNLPELCALGKEVNRLREKHGSTPLNESFYKDLKQILIKKTEAGDFKPCVKDTPAWLAFGKAYEYYCAMIPKYNETDGSEAFWEEAVDELGNIDMPGVPNYVCGILSLPICAIEAQYKADHKYK